MNEFFHFYLKFKNLSKNRKENVSHWQKWNFEHIGSSVDTAGCRNEF